MMASYAKVVRRSAAPTAAIAALMIAISGIAGGAKGLIGALIGVGIVAVFFGISVFVVGRAAKISPPAMMVAALGSYLVKLIALGILVMALHRSTAFNGKLLGLTAIVCILAWSTAQIVASLKLKMLYVEPK